MARLADTARLRRLLPRGGAALRPSAHALVPNASALGRRSHPPRRTASGRRCALTRAFVTGRCAGRARRASPRRGGRRREAFPLRDEACQGETTCWLLTR